MTYHVFRGRLQALLRRDPGYISLSIRWLGWTVGLISALLGTAPAENLSGAPAALAIALVQLVLLTVNPLWLRFEVGLSQKDRGAFLRPFVDLIIALVCLWLTGGWNSPLYLFAITVVLAPSLRYGLQAAFISAFGFSGGFLLVCKASSFGLPGLRADLDLGSGLVSTLASPFMIALFAAFLGEVLQKLRLEQELVEKLAAVNERTRLARDIHDGVAQTLFMLTLSLETGQALAAKEGANNTYKHLDGLIPIARKALLELRNTMQDVEPLELGQKSLAQAVSDLTRDYQSATNIRLEFKKSDSFIEPESHVLDLFRMLQELLSNACHHSGAANIVVSLGCPIDTSLSLTDDGKGFDLSSVKRGRGLDNLISRAKKAGIELKISPFLADGKGTKVEIVWASVVA